MKLKYLLLDVFTEERLKGNPLAVVLKADGLLDDQMQAIAAEFNLSETVFMCKPQLDRHSARVRIFTPEAELPFAGHPTVGAAVVLGMQERSTAVRIEEEIGPVTCIIEKIDKRGGFARFSLPQLPQPAGPTPATAQIAKALGLEEADIGCGNLQPAVFSAGAIFYLVPVRDAAALARTKPVSGGWQDVFPLGRHSVYAFTETPNEGTNDYAARMFKPGLGAGEDPATGSAAAALIGLLAETAADGQTELIVRQGKEMGRPSRIFLQMRKDNGQLTHGAIGGHAVVLGEGVLDFDD